jgi:hypothetical protein
MKRRWVFTPLRLNEPRANMTALCFAFCILAIFLWLQPSRFSATPSYANLLSIAPAQVWSAVYALPALMMMASIWRYTNRTLVIATHTLTIALLLGWEYAFIVRMVTDHGTTVVNPLNWGLMLFMAVRSFLLIEVHVTGVGGRHHEHS